MGEDFKVIIWRANHKGLGPFFMRRWTLKTPCKDFHLAIRPGLGWMKWLKNGAEKGFYISCNYSYTISFLEKILLVKLKNLYIQYDWISIMKKYNINQNVEIEKMVVFVKTFDCYHHKFNFANFFSFPIKLLKSLKLKFRPKFNHGFTIIWAIYNVLFEML